MSTKIIQNSKPLIDVATAQLIQSSSVTISEDEIDSCRNNLEKYISGEMSFEECTNAICSICSSLNSAIDCVQEIKLVMMTESAANSFNSKKRHQSNNEIKHMMTFSSSACEEESENEILFCSNNRNATNASSFNDQNPKGRTRLWSKEEDRKLLHAITIFGLGKWKDICVFVGSGRTRAQCSQRWYRSLDPRISKDRWTSDEDSRLLKSVSVNGDHTWTKVAQDVKTRSDVQCRYRYSQIQKSMNYSMRSQNQQISAAFKQQCICQQLLQGQMFNNSPIVQQAQQQQQMKQILLQQQQQQQQQQSFQLKQHVQNLSQQKETIDDEEKINITLFHVDDSDLFGNNSAQQFKQVTISNDSFFTAAMGSYEDTLLDQIMSTGPDFDNDFQDFSTSFNRDYMEKNLFDF